ncbi:HTH_Tnp_Tc3_2 domain-containing protein [Trichonephila clavipes]|nr:HTH_Tnp_Tc3_2 domain-containing protein [Trichonephila clavipes]
MIPTLCEAVRVRDGKNHRDDGCWWTEEPSFSLRPGSGRLQTSGREARYIIRHASVEPTASLTAVQIQVSPSLRASVSSQIIARCLTEGHLVSRRQLRVLAMTPPTDASVWRGCHARRDWPATKWN